MKISGIYQIKNLVNSKIYIGSSKDVYLRRTQHFRKLRQNKHINAILQHSFNMYGIDNFEFEVLITCHPNMLLFYEQQFLDQWKPELNVATSATAPFTGGHHTDKTKKTCSEAITKRKRDNSKLFYGLLSPNGVEYRNIFNMSNFCRENGLDRGGIGSVIKESRPSYKGWKLLKEGEITEVYKKVYYTLVSPDEVVYSNIIEIKKFCIEHKLNSKRIHTAISTGTRHKGWRAFRKEY